MGGRGNGGRPFGVLALGVAIVAGALPVLLGAAMGGATSGAQVTRVAGVDRIATAIAVSQAQYAPGTAAAAVLARADAYPDALAGTPLAVAKHGPLLLTVPAALDSRVGAELQRVLPAGATVFVLGGSAAISPGVAAAVQSLGYQVVRYGGANRFETATLVADQGLGDPTTVFVTTGADFPDALVAGVPAGRLGAAVLLTDGSAVPAATSDYLSAHHPATTYAVGGAAAAAEPGAQAIAGADRYDTGRLVASKFFTGPTLVGVASGVSFPDALSAGPFLASGGAPLLLTDPSALPPATTSYLQGNESTITGADLFGGPAAVGSFAEAGIQAAITGNPPPTTTTAAPAHFSTLPPGAPLPSDQTCAAEVRPAPENRYYDAPYDSTPGVQKNLTQPYPPYARVDGAFTGTTDEIIQWAACKWGIDEDIVRAQAAVESWWDQRNEGNWTTDSSQCAPGHGIGADGKAGQCPTTFGLLSIAYPYAQAAFPQAISSTAYNLDWAYADWRSCYEGDLTWLNTVDRNGTYGPGDAWGCVGVHYAGRWHTTAADDYIQKVQAYLNERIWTLPQFVVSG